MIHDDDIMISIFTPTFNRCYVIDNLYQSLVRQSYKNYEWIVIDQGEDDTQKRIQDYKQEGSIFNIIYIKNNERIGINRAYNDALKIARGELFFKVDDDDFLSDDALAEIVAYYKTIRNSGEKMAGVAGLRGYHDGTPIGTKWKIDGDFVDATNFERKKLGLSGDKAEAYITEVLRAYAPLPEVNGEKYTDEGILYYRIADGGYKIRWFNKIIYYTEYLEDGITVNWRSVVRKNPITFKNRTIEYMKYRQFTYLYKIHLFATYSSIYRELCFKKKEIFDGFSLPFIVLELGWLGGYFADFIKVHCRK